VGGIETDYLVVGAGAAGMAFADGQITLQQIRACQPVFSAAWPGTWRRPATAMAAASQDQRAAGEVAGHRARGGGA